MSIQTRQREPFAHTYSIVARDPATGEMGVAVQSHAFSVGSAVTWGEAGLGVVATQSLTRIDYGPEGLALMREGVPAPEALARLVAADDNREVRQVAMLDAQGRVAVHTGSLCIPFAGYIVGENFSVQANLMTNETVWPAMRDAYVSATGDLTMRLLASLDAAQAAGGDIRGQQSSALLVVPGQKQPKPWQGRIFDLRVDDHPQPLAELRRLVTIRRADYTIDRAIELGQANKWEEARSLVRDALGTVPDMVEFKFWSAAALISGGDVDFGLALFKEVFAREPFWIGLVGHLVKLKLLPEDPAVLEKILAQR